MTKKDYELIASALNMSLRNWNADLNESHELPVEAIKQTAEIVAFALSTDNPRFNRDRFLAACGVVRHDRGIRDRKEYPDDRNAREHAAKSHGTFLIDLDPDWKQKLADAIRADGDVRERIRELEAKLHDLDNTDLDGANKIAVELEPLRRLVDDADRDP